MSIFNYFVDKLRSGIITFVNMVTLANRDYPYHDYETATMKATKQSYRVGENNRTGEGTQGKLFVSKSTLIYATQNAYININSSENVDQLILANNFYEFDSNIVSVDYRYVTIEGIIYIWVEGVLSSESRSAHN